MEFGIVGGDSRYSELARLLERDGHTVRACRVAGDGIAGTVSETPDALEQALSAETVILPLPLCREAGYLNCAGKPLAIADVLDLLARPSKPPLCLPERAEQSGGSPADRTGEHPAEQAGRLSAEQSGGSPAERTGGPHAGQSGGPHAEQSGEHPVEQSGVSPGRLVLAGMVPESVAEEAARRGIRLVDYFRLESLTVANAAATADAALCLTVQHTRQTLTGKRCLVLGFGRIGKLLCLRLGGAGASVTAAARKGADRAWIRACGCEALNLHSLDFRGVYALPGQFGRHGRSERSGGFDLVYNTVPAPVLDRRLLEELAGSGDSAEERPLLVELATRPGFDRAAAERLGLRVLPANGLPGKIVPMTAAAVLREAVYEILTEESAARGNKSVFDSERVLNAV